MRAYERIDLFDVRQPMKPWLYKIAYRLAQERWRAWSRETARLEAAATMLRRTAAIQGLRKNCFPTNDRRYCGRLSPNCRWPNGLRLCFTIVRI